MRRLTIGMLAALLAVLALPCCGQPDAGTGSLPPQTVEQNSGMLPQQEVGQNSEMLPAPELEETYPQLMVTEEDNFAFMPAPDKNSEHYPLPFRGRPEPTAAFGAKNGLAVVACGSGPVQIAVSEDNGKSWLKSIELKTGMAALEGISVGFYTMRDGWLLMTDSKESAVYTTADGGASWSLAGKTEPGELVGSRFVSRETGWIAYYHTEEAAYGAYSSIRLMETHDGGKTWAEANTQVGADMMYGEPQLGLGLPYWDGQAWRIWAEIYHAATYRKSWLELVPQGNNGQELVWVEKTKGWDLPEGISEAYFSNGIDFFRPLEYDAATGLGVQQIDEFYLLCDAAGYFARVGRLEEKERDVLLSVEQVNEFALYQYGPVGFDATQLYAYDPEIGKLTHTEGHEGLGQHWKILEAETTPEGNIRVLYERMVVVMGKSLGLDEEEDGKSECIYKPYITPDGIQVFTLLSSHVLS